MQKKEIGIEWVICLSCEHEYFIESYDVDPECPICESKQFEQSTFKGLSEDDLYE